MPSILHSRRSASESRARSKRAYEAAHKPGHKIPTKPEIVARRKAPKPVNPVMQRIKQHRQARAARWKRENLRRWCEDTQEREAMGLKRRPTKRQRKYLIETLGYSPAVIKELSMGEAADIIEKASRVHREHRDKARRGMYYKRDEPLWLKTETDEADRE